MDRYSCGQQATQLRQEELLCKFQSPSAWDSLQFLQGLKPAGLGQRISIILTAELVIRRPESKGSNCNKTRQEFELLEIIFSRNCDHCTKYLSHEQRCLTGIAPLHFKIFLGTLITFEACPSVFVCLCIFNYGVNTGPEHEFCNCFLQTQY